MNKNEWIRTLILHFFIIYTGTMFATLAIVSSTDPTTQIPISYLWQAGLFSLAADLTTLVYYSKNELSRKQHWIRTVIHTVLIEIVLMTMGYFIGMYRGFIGGCVMVAVILLVDVFVRFSSYLIDRKTADEINEKLRHRREERK
ncbi:MULTISPECIES: DUF3021 family protein [unclassified Ruminococcus]|uniref:DUF3021 family protein n=1 Tax=unclassified Ruminococcus TaxID=2608920 RepID=UPI00210EE73C|nr:MULTISPECIES: DUF3021 family protein [unclassified Ruminococcus]MCQ4022074.1 DUF3021 family protein [Ruminococcus sp. zg-924]MCQ4114394.1 DUF3021 family protein [Ruminococcus sp. zg-921]